jgi:hypothetical protein
MPRSADSFSVTLALSPTSGLSVVLAGLPLSDEWVEEILSAAASFASASVGVPDITMMSAMFQVRENLREDLAKTLGADISDLVADAFVATVIRCRREIESAGAASRVLN